MAESSSEMSSKKAMVNWMRCQNCNDPKAATTQRSVDVGGFKGSSKFNLCDKCHRTYQTSRIGLEALPGLESTLAMTPMDEC